MANGIYPKFIGALQKSLIEVRHGAPGCGARNDARSLPSHFVGRKITLAFCDELFARMVL
jgi:hypothetical protein